MEPDDIVKRLLDRAERSPSDFTAKLMREAAAEISRLRGGSHHMAPGPADTSVNA